MSRQPTSRVVEGVCAGDYPSWGGSACRLHSRGYFSTPPSHRRITVYAHMVSSSIERCSQSIGLVISDGLVAFILQIDWRGWQPCASLSKCHCVASAPCSILMPNNMIRDGKAKREAHSIVVVGVITAWTTLGPIIGYVFNPRAEFAHCVTVVSEI